ncbi:MAG: DTW domain-containing protein [Zhongshania sp.]|uniref:tRNA-uridine aminocarboxypropyltransferase n=1 Tax=Zhongshania sp. TaxID=1971902 RepID=UPI002607849C|nr:tRNA-uridine aminocarboxypropyltransferase [Zhongshania sp.]MDF1690875.1 DTW domain-containing protein [Zhongshania sp.]
MTKRQHCLHCDRPQRTCLCDVMVVRNCDYRLVILQDPKEAKHALSSAPLLAKSIAGAELIVGEIFAPEQILGSDWQTNSVLIFPSDNSLKVADMRQCKIKNLILLDGTWRKVARLMHINPWLNTLPRFAIAANNNSQYKIRRSPRADGLSTIEAGVCALNELQTPEDFSNILLAFNKMIDLQISAMGPETFNNNYSKR